jgi:hypothetical protein
MVAPSGPTKKLGQENIPTDTHKVVYQATLKHNCGKKGKNLRLTCTGYSSGISSAVNLALHSEHHKRHWDYVAANPSDLGWFNDKAMIAYERTMHGFEHIDGCGDPGLEEISEQCERCNGVYLEKRMAASPEEVEVSADNSSDDESLEEDSGNKGPPRLRKKCFICKTQTPWACLGCGRSLCLSAPKKKNLQKRLKGQKKEAEKKKKKKQTSKGGKGGKARKGGGKRKQQSIKGKSIQAKPSMVQPKIKASYPALFCVEVPMMSNGRIQTNDLGAPML